MPIPTAHFLVIHGSRDPRPTQALEQLIARVQAQLPRLGSSPGLVGGGQLEGAQQSLDIQICEFAQLAAAKGIARIQLMPLFLQPGVHVRVDIPAAMAAATPHLSPEITLTASEYLGAQPGLATYVGQRLQQQPNSQRVILAHGSRRPGGNQPILDLAARWQASAAFWSVAPHIHDVIAQLVMSGTEQIGIFPYFLFPGTLWDAMIQTIEQLQQQFPDCKISLDRPLEVSDALVALILELTQMPG